MPAFRSEILEELTRQITFAPPEMRRRQMLRAEDLYWQVDPERAYPFAFIVYRITEFRPETDVDTTLVGRAVRDDLLLLVERVSASLSDRIADMAPPPLTLVEAAAHLGVSEKTIHRYRRAGLFGRRMISPDGRRRLAFMHHSIERFVASRRTQVDRAQRFSRIDAKARDAIVIRARRITSRVDVTPQRLARYLAQREKRSVEAIRHLLWQHDHDDPRFAVFLDRTGPLTARQTRIIARAYRRGVAVARLAERFGKKRDTIYHAINQRRAAALRRLDIRYVAYPTFDHPDAEQIILGPIPGAPVNSDEDHADDQPQTSPAADLPHPLTGLFDSPPLERDEERAWFVRYNYLKSRAAATCEQLDPYHPRVSELDRIETDLRRAEAARGHIARANVRQVVSVARRHLGTQGSFDDDTLSRWVALGRDVLLDAIEAFDASHGQRFSAYLTWALMRRFAREDDPPAAPSRPQTSYLDRALPVGLVPSVSFGDASPYSPHDVQELLGALDEQARLLVTQHYGLLTGDEAPDPQTLADIADQLQMTSEQVRAIERRALTKLHRAAAQREADREETR